MQGFAEIASAVVSFAECSTTFVPCFPSVCGIFIRRPAHLKGVGADAKSEIVGQFEVMLIKYEASSRHAAFFSRVRDLPQIPPVGDPSLRLKDGSAQDDAKNMALKFKVTHYEIGRSLDLAIHQMFK